MEASLGCPNLKGANTKACNRPGSPNRGYTRCWWILGQSWNKSTRRAYGYSISNALSNSNKWLNLESWLNLRKGRFTAAQDWRGLWRRKGVGSEGSQWLWLRCKEADCVASLERYRILCRLSPFSSVFQEFAIWKCIGAQDMKLFRWSKRCIQQVPF